MIRRTAAAVVACLGTLLAPPSLVAAPPLRIEAGQPLVEALRELERHGLNVIYSSKLVGSGLSVTATPADGELPDVLARLLAPHGLAAEAGAAGAWIVVRAGPGRGLAEPAPVAFDEIVVTPSHYALLKTRPEASQFLSRDEVRKLPHLSDDLYRAVSWLPGTANGDISADFHIRGGEAEEILVVLDGAEIYDPFHLKDLNIFSSLDAEAIGGVDFLTGGFPVEYGDRMSGVLDISSLQPPGRRRTTLGASFVNARILSAGAFGGDRGSWLVSLRRGYLDIILDFANSSDEDDLDPVYYDLLSRVEISLDDRQTLAVNVQGAYDDFDFVDRDGSSSARSREDNAYLWLRLGSLWGPRLYSNSVLSTSRIRRRRDGRLDGFELKGEVDDRRAFDLHAFKQDWGLDLGESQLLKWGYEAQNGRGDVAFESWSWVDEPTFTLGGPPVEDAKSVDERPAGNAYAAYAADRVRLSDRTTAEIGVRWDHQDYVDGGDQVSPRFNLVHVLGAKRRSLLRLSWGRFYQSQGLHELQVEDGIDEYFPAQLAEHRVIGFEHALSSERGPRTLRGAGVRLELYQKVMSHLRPRFENVFDVNEYLAEIWPGRVRIDPESAEAKGVEVLVKQPGRGRFSWWASYVWSSIDDVIDGVDVPRSWDQEHSVTASLSWHRKLWTFNVSGIHHSGWPTTEVTLHTVLGPDGSEELVRSVGPRNGERFPSYRRVDFRASRRVETRRGTLELFFELTNVFDRRNICCKDDHDLAIENGRPELVVREEYWMPRIPSFGVSWEF